MKEYHKIHTVFKRDPANKYRTLLMGEYSHPEFAYLRYNDWVFTEKVDGTNIRIIQQLLGHRSLRTTEVYTHVARTFYADTPSPLDRLASCPAR